MLRRTCELICKLIEKQFQTDEVKKLINDNLKFDLLLTESFVKITLMISHFYNVPVLEISSLAQIYGDFENMGAPVQPLLYPRTMRKRINNLTLWDEILELYRDYVIYNIFYETLTAHTRETISRTPFYEAPDIDILKNNVHMLYLNTHPIWDAIRPVPPSVIYTYGIHQKPDNELLKDLASYLDASVNGVIFVSFGTTADVCQYSAKLQILLNAFSKLPYDILFKWNEDELPGKPNNVKIGKWFPQADLLKHSKIKAFITQGGTQSSDEAIDAGVPVIGIPLIWDQWANVERYVRHGIGIKLEMDEITEEQLINAVNTVISDDSYRRNMKKLRSILWDAPQSPEERAVWWMEYLVRHGGAHHLRAPAANMSYAEFFEIELFVIIFSILFVICAIPVYLLLPSCFP
ncbi:UDP-glucosyltransferase 2-like [Aphomia sociella]